MTPRRSRRRFMKQSTLALGAAFMGLKGFTARAAAGGETASVDLYGPLVPDPEGLLDLPRGFRYRVLTRTGDPMDDGLVVPGFPDGMGAFAADDGKVVLVRNHELESKGEIPERTDQFRKLGPFGPRNELLDRVDRRKLYDPGAADGYPSLGGTTNVVYDPSTGNVESQFLSLAGTERNCAGGITPWGTWITCEESSEIDDGEYLADHGYAFEVEPTTSVGLQTARPYRDMGRFRREAVAIDPRTGIVYQTEDVGDGLFTRFVPRVPGRLDLGGRLQALALARRTKADTRNWEESEGERLEPDTPVEVRWIDLDDVRAPKNDLRHRGRAAGAAVFSRGEGIWWGDGVVYFACTDGGPKRLGQIFRYRPSAVEGEKGERDAPGVLELFVESTDDRIIQNADNLTTAPWGGLVVCEDRATESHIRGVTLDGRVYTLGRNALNGTEFAGACFAPGLDTLFVNIQKPGITLAIDGPWQGA